MNRDRDDVRAGFTLIEALVAMALLLAFLSVLVPQLFHARRIVAHIDDRIAAQELLRSLLDAPVDRATLGNGARDGETDLLHWSVAAEPMFVDAMVSDERASEEAPRVQPAADKGQDKDKATASRPHWRPFRVIATVTWGDGHSLSGETLRLGLIPGLVQ